MIPTYPFQEEAAGSIALSRAKLLADQPGLGKTHTAIKALHLAGLLDRPGAVTLIAAPITVCGPAWADKFRQFYPDVRIVRAWDGPTAKRDERIAKALEHPGPIVIIANHDALGRDRWNVSRLPALHAISLDAIVIDECQYVLPAETDTPQDSTQFWRGLFALNARARTDCIRLAISGTPDRGKNWYRFGTWRFLRPRVMERTTYERWLTEHFVTWIQEVPIKGRQYKGKVRRVGRMKNPTAWANLDRMLVIRRTKAEVASQMPKKLYLDVDVPFEGKQAADYHAFCATETLHDDGTQKHAATAALRAQQWATCSWAHNELGELMPVVGGHSSKLDWIVEFLDKRGHLPTELHNELGGQVVFASQYVRVLNWLEAELNARGVPTVKIVGEDSAVERETAQRLFQEGEVRVVLLSAKLGVGIDLDAADDLVLIDLPRDPDTQEQVEDRIHRLSRIHQVMIWRLRARGTIDTLIQAKNDKVYHQTRELLDGRRGVEFERKLLARLGQKR